MAFCNPLIILSQCCKDVAKPMQIWQEIMEQYETRTDLNPLIKIKLTYKFSASSCQYTYINCH